MGKYEDKARTVLAETKQYVVAAGMSPTDPNIPLSLLAGILTGYAEIVQKTMEPMPREEAQDLINAVYVFLGDYETSLLAEGFDDD
jgi:hypothetical protein